MSDTFIAGWAVVVGWCYIMTAHVAGMSGNPVSCQPPHFRTAACHPACLRINGHTEQCSMFHAHTLHSCRQFHGEWQSTEFLPQILILHLYLDNLENLEQLFNCIQSLESLPIVMLSSSSGANSRALCKLNCREIIPLLLTHYLVCSI